MVPQHPSDIEAFHGEQTITIDQSISNLVMWFTSQITNSSMQLGNLGDSFTTILAALLLAWYRTLASAQLRQLLLEETRISYVLTIVCRKKAFQTDFDANSRVLKALPSLPRPGEDDAP